MNGLGKTADVSKSAETPYYANVDDLRKAAKCVFLATDKAVAQDLADKLNGAANMIDEMSARAVGFTGYASPLKKCKYLLERIDGG